MTPPPPSQSSGGDRSPETERIGTQRTPETDKIEMRRVGGGGAKDAPAPEGDDDRRTQAIAVLDEPLDDKDDLREQIARPGLSRSTQWLLALLAAVVLFGLGTLLGRATAPDTGPGSEPDVVGSLESVVSGGSPGATLLTVRTIDGQQVVLDANPGTAVGVTQPAGVGALRAGQRVVIGAERNQEGGLDATRVELNASP